MEGAAKVAEANSVTSLMVIVFGFFFQAEDGIRDVAVTGVRTCALPIFFAAHMAEMKVLSHEANSLTGERLRKVNAIKRRYVDLLEGLLEDVAPDESAVDRKIGRASCRERG